MRRLTHNVAAWLLAFTLGWALCPVGENIIGRIESHLDLWQGMTNVRRCAEARPPTEQTRVYERILLRQYGVNAVPTGACMGDWSNLQRTRGYNAVSRAFIEERYGRDFWNRARRQMVREINGETDDAWPSMSAAKVE